MSTFGEIRVIPPGPFFVTLEENSASSHRLVLPVPVRKGLLPIAEQPELVWLRNDKVNCLQIHPAPVLFANIEQSIAESPEEERPALRRYFYRDFSVTEVNKDFRLTMPKLADLPSVYAWENCQRAVFLGFGKYAWLFSEVAYNRYLALQEAAVENLASRFQEMA